MSFQETFITINDCRVRIRRKGQGAPMIYLHGADGAAMINLSWKPWPKVMT